MAPPISDPSLTYLLVDESTQAHPDPHAQLGPVEDNGLVEEGEEGDEEAEAPSAADPRPPRPLPTQVAEEEGEGGPLGHPAK